MNKRSLMVADEPSPEIHFFDRTITLTTLTIDSIEPCAGQHMVASDALTWAGDFERQQ